MTDTTYILVSRYYMGHDHYFTEDTGTHDQEFHTIQGTWKVHVGECVGNKALYDAIEECYEEQARDPPYSNAYPIIAYQKDSMEVVWVSGQRVETIWSPEPEYADQDFYEPEEQETKGGN
jgi:hypothetical protein